VLIATFQAGAGRFFLPESAAARGRLPALEGNHDMNRLADIQLLLRRSLHLDESVSLDPEVELLGGLPEFDSMAVVVILEDIDLHFGVRIPDDEVEAEMFLTVGSLHDAVVSRLQ
jgi:acyl carrier protein